MMEGNEVGDGGFCQINCCALGALLSRVRSVLWLLWAGFSLAPSEVWVMSAGTGSGTLSQGGTWDQPYMAANRQVGVQALTFFVLFRTSPGWTS